MINEKVIDTHLHIEAWENSEYPSFIDCFEGHREQSGLSSFNICCLPTAERTVCNNMMAAFYKIAHPNTYAHGGFDHIIWPITDNMPEGMDLVTQYRELMEIGFDGIKMIEGKPTVLKRIGNDLCHPALDRVYAEMERDGTHVVFHINDPDVFWDKDKVDPEHVKRGWFYGDGTYSTYEQIWDMAHKIFEAHPNMNITLAHFFFCGECPEHLEELFAKYPNLAVDLTPGCEMYHSFESRPEYFRDFFERNSKRVMLGTDGTFPWGTHCHVWCMDILYRYITTRDSMMAFDDSILTGIALEGEVKEDILYKNFEHRVGREPKAINKAALKAYIDKYKHLLNEEELSHIEPLYNKYL